MCCFSIQLVLSRLQSVTLNFSSTPNVYSKWTSWKVFKRMWLPFLYGQRWCCYEQAMLLLLSGLSQICRKRNCHLDYLPYFNALAQDWTFRVEIACVAWRFCWAGRRSGIAARKIKTLLPPQSPRGFSALARLYYLARPTKTATLRRLVYAIIGTAPPSCLPMVRSVRHTRLRMCLNQVISFA